MWQSPDSKLLSDKKLLFLLLLGLIGVLTILYSTRWGVGIAYDSFGYLSGAENLLRGQGYSHVTGLGEIEPTNQWPPLFSLAITPFGFAGLSVSEGARWLNALLFGINILLIGYFVYRNTTFWPAIFASLITLTSIDLIRLHTTAYSEPLYFFLGLTGLYFLDNYLNTSRTRPLIISALLISAATLTRYIGFTLIVTLCISILILGKRSLGHRLIACSIAGAISSLPLLLLIIRNVFVSGRTVVSMGSPHVRLVTAGHLREGLNTISLWFLPNSVSFSLRERMLVAVAVVMLLMLAWFRKSIASSFWFLNVIYVVVYCLSVILVMTSIDPRLPYDYRYLSPVFVSVVIILALSIYRISLRAGRGAGIGIAVLCVLFPIFYVEGAALVVKDIHDNGQWFEAPALKRSKIMTSIKDLPANVRIYSCLPILVRFFTQREIRDLPWKHHPSMEMPSPDYLQKLQEIEASSQSQRTVIVYHHWRPPFYPTEDELKQVLPLNVIENAPDGTIYEVLH